MGGSGPGPTGKGGVSGGSYNPSHIGHVACLIIDSDVTRIVALSGGPALAGGTAGGWGRVGSAAAEHWERAGRSACGRATALACRPRADRLADCPARIRRGPAPGRRAGPAIYYGMRQRAIPWASNRR